MSDSVIELSGKNEGIEWSISVYMNASMEYYSVVKVGSTLRVTSNRMLKDTARDEGCQCMADLLAEKMEDAHA